MPVHDLLSDDAIAPPAATGSSDVRGLVDNATASRLYGWCWDAAHPEHRVTVELRLSGEVVATTVADYARPDLAKHGIGDGCHAFEFPLLRQWFRQMRDISVIGIGKDGSEFPVPVHATRGQDEMLVPAQATAKLHSAAEALLAEHQGVRREIEELRLRSAQLPDVTAVDAIAKAGQELQRRIDGLELWINRLDGRLAELTVPATTQDRGRVDVWQAILIAILLAAVSAAAAAVLVRHGL
ncbi:MAG: rane protein [Belnapia sp.]|nr:rane protein [Belnapia sp.]